MLVEVNSRCISLISFVYAPSTLRMWQTYVEPAKTQNLEYISSTIDEATKGKSLEK